MLIIFAYKNLLMRLKNEAYEASYELNFDLFLTFCFVPTVTGGNSSGTNANIFAVYAYDFPQTV